MRFRELKLQKDEHCPICGKSPTIHELIDYDQFCGIGPGNEPEPVDALEPLELKARLDAGEEIQIIDIREPHERAISPFPNSKYIPLGQMVRRIGEFDESKDAVFLCKIGQRSVFAIRALRDAGYKGNLYNLKDGVNAWARDIDNSMPQY
jgi:adenylyltransferase/sulfurtransferase